MSECYYCENGEALGSLMIHVKDIGNASVYLYRDQTHRGKCIVVYRTAHKTEWYQLSDEEQAELIHAVSRTAEALDKVFYPDKINYATYGDKVNHLHVHIVPKYKDGPDWGVPFKDTRPPFLLEERQYDERVNEIRAAIERLE
ncbi:HIT family protein [Muricomes sp. OA1]|uniref:HIT family protein n=1 Tax=Hungatella hathewayi TaxID=154046 RepID=A0A3E2WV22_9FIRM|nr:MULTISPECIES: HIT family protein [Clostridia]MCH1972110.1 HIT family protein [Muricomes sp. OA1]MEE0201807.1 HIT family protein [Muricomes sp.]RGC31313.1 HIT family protein [Hungatella hathewayi]GKH30918.1 hypothetical protein CE91St64_03250 [Faecalicatena contorta]